MNTTLSIAVTGLEGAFRRIQASANNIANSGSEGRLPDTPGGQATSYRPVRAITLPVTSGDGSGLGIRTELQNVEPAYTIAQNTDSPHANEDGLVAVPNVDLVNEAIEIHMATVVYKANAAVIKATKDMDDVLVDILA